MSEKNKSETHRFFIKEEQSLQRLDKALSALHSDLSRARIQALIDQGQVLLNGYKCETASKKVEVGDVVELTVPPPVSAVPKSEDIPLDIVYEDDDLIVLNKAVGLVVHQGAGNYDGTLVNALLHYCGDSLSGIGGVMRPGIVHRLDKDTSGLMVVAKNDKAHQGLSSQLEDRSLSRRYKALVLGCPMPPKGFVEEALGRHPGNRLKMAVLKEDGKEAKTYYKVLQTYREELALLECQLESGRTHQIRVHMGYIKYPLIGDALYGPQPTAVQGALKRADYDVGTINEIMKFPRQALHAFALSFVHPGTQKQMSFESDLPDDFLNILNLLNK